MIESDPIPAAHAPQATLDADRLADLRWDRDMLNSVSMLCVWLVGMTLGLFTPLIATTYSVVASSSFRAGLPWTAADRVQRLAMWLALPILIAVGIAAAARLTIPPLARMVHRRRPTHAAKTICSERLNRRARRVIVGVAVFIVAGLGVLAAINFDMFTLAFAKQAGAFGALCIYRGLRWRTGDDVSCAHCGYAMNTTAGPSCPECGNPWLNPWRARIGRRRTALRWLLAGIAIWLVLITLSLARANIEY